MGESIKVSKDKLKKIIEKLGSIKGRHTELVTVYVPQGYSLHEISTQLQQEVGTAENIKSKAVKKNVVSALEKIVQHLKLFKETPKNGMAIFCGNVSESEGKTDVQIWAIEPPEELNTKLYWCDQRFEMEPLLDMMEEKELYGMLVFDSKEATFAILKGKRMDIIDSMDSIVPGKTKAGGQSSARYGRVREGMLHDFLKKIAERFIKIFSDEKIKGVIVGGPGPLKEIWVEGDLLPENMKEKIMGIRNVGYTNEVGLEELLNSVDDILAESETIKEKKILTKFFDEVYKTGGKAIHGLEKTLKAIQMGAAETVLVSDKCPLIEIEFVDESGKGEKKFIDKADKRDYKILGERDIFDCMEEAVESIGAEAKLVSDETKEGQAFMSIGGIGAILRFAFE